MQAQKTCFDEFEEDINKEFLPINETLLKKEKGAGRWTKAVNNAVSKVSKKRGYKVCASKCDQKDGAEWLYDLTCLEEENGYLKSILLVLESEWENTKKIYKDEILYDFKKLLVSRADHRIMVLDVKSEEEEKEIIDQLLQHVEKCRHSTIGDRYLFACWNKEEQRFRCSPYVIKE
ncbi:MAG: hypothetical protein WAK60_11200 [Sedimentisphaerales bacterium]